MSKFKNFLWVALAFIMDAIAAFVWYIILFPTEPVTTVVAVIAGAIMAFFTALILVLNWVVFSTSLAEES